MLTFFEYSTDDGRVENQIGGMAGGNANKILHMTLN